MLFVSQCLERDVEKRKEPGIRFSSEGRFLDALGISQDSEANARIGTSTHARRLEAHRGLPKARPRSKTF